MGNEAELTLELPCFETSCCENKCSLLCKLTWVFCFLHPVEYKNDIYSYLASTRSFQVSLFPLGLKYCPHLILPPGIDSGIVLHFGFVFS